MLVPSAILQHATSASSWNALVVIVSVERELGRYYFLPGLLIVVLYTFNYALCFCMIPLFFLGRNTYKVPDEDFFCN